MTIPFGRRRLILTLVVAAAPARPEIPAAAGASDAELVRLSRPESVAWDRALWEAQATAYGIRPR